MKKNELVWRELIDAAVMRQQRRWDNVEDLAFRAGVAPATTAYALRRLIEIGAIQQHHAGFTVVNPGKVLTLACAARSIVNDARATLTLGTEDLHRLLDSSPPRGIILGGAAAAVELLGGANTVSDYSEHVLYIRDDQTQRDLDDVLSHMNVTRHTGYSRDRGNVTLLRADPRAARMWMRYTPFGQTYADLFATPGWQASEFRLALDARFLGQRDWDQERQ